MRCLWVIVGGLVLGMLPLGQAAVVNVGSSGSCDGPAGGGDNARVVVDTADPAAASARAPTGTGAVAGFTQLATGYAGGSDPTTTNPCPGPRRDWLEADASVDGTGAQVCWAGALLTDGSCPTSA